MISKLRNFTSDCNSDCSYFYDSVVDPQFYCKILSPKKINRPSTSNSSTSDSSSSSSSSSYSSSSSSSFDNHEIINEQNDENTGINYIKDESREINSNAELEIIRKGKKGR